MVPIIFKLDTCTCLLSLNPQQSLSQRKWHWYSLHRRPGVLVVVVMMVGVGCGGGGRGAVGWDVGPT
jgi:hypothetical protein